MADDHKSNPNQATTAQPIAEATKSNGDDSLSIKVWAPFRVYFDGKAKSISGVNGTGMFDVLAHHHNFITLLNTCELSIRSRNSETKIKISGGVMHVHQDTVTVFLDV